MSDYPIEQIRSRFPGLTRRVNGHQAIFFDGPGEVSLRNLLRSRETLSFASKFNVGMSFATSKETDELMNRQWLRVLIFSVVLTIERLFLDKI